LNKRFIKLLAPIVLVSISLIMSLSSSVQASDGNYQSIKGKKIMLDPGHGGKDPGAVKNGYYEKNLNSQLTEKVAVKLCLMGANIVFTREPANDIFVELVDRPVIANESKADLFISIHHNSSVSSTPKGVSTHYSSFKPGVETNDVYVEYNNVKYKFISEAEVNGTRGFYINYNGVKKFVSVNDATAFDPTPSEEAKRGRALAEKLVNAVAGLGLENDGSSDHNLYVTKTTNMPSLVIEAGYISNSTEVKKLADPAFQDKIAEKVAVSVAEYFEEYYPQPEIVIGWFKDASGNWYYIKDASGNRMSG
jgi:N-acetylmuramoyl-L-alanine amidase